MRALVTGATGFIGRALVAALRGRGVRPVVLSRDPERARRTLGDVEAHAWDAERGDPPGEALASTDTIFHLAGEPIAAERWSARRKARLRDSRVAGTRHLVAAMRRATEPPRVLVSASAVGYYGDRGDEALDESAPPGDDFLATLCRDWEEEALAARDVARVVTPRIGLVLGAGGGVLAKMAPPFRLGLGGRLGNGAQWMPWIHLADLVALLLHAAEHDALAGAVNAVGIAPVTNREFTRALGRALGRPAVLPVPAPALRLLFGEMAFALLASTRALPSAALRAGFAFQHPDLDETLRDALGGGP
jgi:uncharacterized protein (TIGR01777 family)